MFIAFEEAGGLKRGNVDNWYMCSCIFFVPAALFRLPLTLPPGSVIYGAREKSQSTPTRSLDAEPSSPTQAGASSSSPGSATLAPLGSNPEQTGGCDVLEMWVGADAPMLGQWVGADAPMLGQEITLTLSSAQPRPSRSWKYLWP
jgi:hypothetical protein